MLAEAILGVAGKLLWQLGQFIALAWEANGDKAKIEKAGEALAEALGILVSALLVVVAAYLLKRGVTALSKTKFAQKVGETRLAKWLEERQKMTTTQDPLAKEKAAKEKAAKEKAAKEKADKEKADKEKADKEKADKEKADKEKADKEKNPSTHPAIDPARRTLTANEVTPGMEIDPTQVNVFRGGPALKVRPNIDVQFVKGTQTLKKGYGLSLDVSAPAMDKFGGACRIDYIPPELRIVQRGSKLGHFEIMPRIEMSLERYQQLVDQIRMTGG